MGMLYFILCRFMAVCSLYTVTDSIGGHFSIIGASASGLSCGIFFFLIFDKRHDLTDADLVFKEIRKCFSDCKIIRN